MPKPYLMRRLTGMYVRFYVPADIRAKVGNRCLIRSLKGASEDTARLMAARMACAFSRAIQAIRTNDSSLDAKQTLDSALLLPPNEDSHSYEINIPGVLSLKIEGPHAHERTLEALSAVRKILPVPTACISPNLLPSPPPSVKGSCLHESSRRFLAHYASTPRAASTQMEAKHSVALFADIIGDVPVAELQATHIDAFRDALASWPARARVMLAYKGLNSKEVVAKAKQRGEGGIGIRTMEKHLDRLRTFFSWLVQRRELLHNPLKGFRLQSNADKYARTKRAFRPIELSALFDPVRRSKHCSKDPLYFWIPLFGLFTGARLRETAQLLLSDLSEVGGVWGIHITGEGQKSIKNAQSRRFVPVPERLLEVGLLDYAAEVKALGFAELFPGGSIKAKNGPGDRCGKWFNRTFLRVACGISDKAVSYHSTRHTFVTAGDSLGFTENQVGCLTGHEARSVQARHYIDASTVSQRKERIDRIAASMPVPPLAVYQPGQFAQYFKTLRNQQRRLEAVIARQQRAVRRKLGPMDRSSSATKNGGKNK